MTWVKRIKAVSGGGRRTSQPLYGETKRQQCRDAWGHDSAHMKGKGNKMKQGETIDNKNNRRHLATETGVLGHLAVMMTR